MGELLLSQKWKCTNLRAFDCAYGSFVWQLEGGGCPGQTRYASRRKHVNAYGDTFIEHWLSSSWNKLQPGERSPRATTFNYIWLIKDMNEALHDWSLSSALRPALIGFLTPTRGINRFISKEAEGLLFPPSASIAADCNYRVEAEKNDFPDFTTNVPSLRQQQ